MDSMESSGAVSPLAEVLAARGLAPAEVRTYDVLVEAGTATPAQIARITGQSRGRAYEVLRSLVERGLAHEEPTRPIRFRAVPLQDVIDRTLRELAAQQKVLQTLQNQIPKRTSRRPSTEPVSVKDLAVITGRKAVVAEMKRMAQVSRLVMYVGGGGQLGNRLAQVPDLLQELNAAKNRHAQVRVVLLESLTLDSYAEAIARALGRDTMQWMAPEKAVPIAFAVNERVALVVIVQPDDNAPLRGDDLAIRFESQAMVDAIITRLEQFGSDG